MKETVRPSEQSKDCRVKGRSNSSAAENVFEMEVPTRVSLFSSAWIQQTRASSPRAHHLAGAPLLSSSRRRLVHLMLASCKAATLNLLSLAASHLHADGLNLSKHPWLDNGLEC